MSNLEKVVAAYLGMDDRRQEEMLRLMLLVAMAFPRALPCQAKPEAD